MHPARGKCIAVAEGVVLERNDEVGTRAALLWGFVRKSELNGKDECYVTDVKTKRRRFRLIN